MSAADDLTTQLICDEMPSLGELLKECLRPAMSLEEFQGAQYKIGDTIKILRKKEINYESS